MTHVHADDRNKDIIWLLEFTLDIAQELAEKQREWESEFLYFRLSCEADYHTTKEHFADELLADIYHSLLLESDERSQVGSGDSRKISFEVLDDGKCRVKEIKKELQAVRIDYLGCDEEDDRRLAELLTGLDKSFLLSDTLTCLKEKVGDFIAPVIKRFRCSEIYSQVARRLMSSLFSLRRRNT